MTEIRKPDGQGKAASLQFVSNSKLKTVSRQRFTGSV